MRRLLPWLGALAALVLLWPTTCTGAAADASGAGSAADGTIACSSMVVRYAWGERSDAGMVVAALAAAAAYVLLRLLLKRRGRRSR